MYFIQVLSENSNLFLKNFLLLIKYNVRALLIVSLNSNKAGGHLSHPATFLVLITGSAFCGSNTQSLAYGLSSLLAAA
ncbi:MAG: hypothetical protein ABJC98_08640, partial [Bacteroidota bacterium]